MAKAGKNYGNESISLLEGAERVRKRPGVIFGSDGLDGCEHAVFEILSNSIDEAREGHGKGITLTHYADGSIEVEDNGRGCPVDWNPKEKRYNWELVYCELYAGGKYNNLDGDNYEYSLGLNGLGACATQYASRYMDVTVWRDGNKYSLHFERGQITGKKGEELKIEPTDRGKKTGTLTRWLPDLDVFTDINIPASYFTDVLRRQAVVNAGITFRFRDQVGGKFETQEFLYENGIVDYVTELAGEGALTTPVFWETERRGRDREDKPEYKVKLSCACCFSNRVNVIEHYHNSSWLEHGGAPEKATKTAFVYAIDKYLKDSGKYQKNESKITWQDVEDCLVLVSNNFSTQTSYENQTKKSITNKFVQEAMTDFLKSRLETYFIENRVEALKIAEQVLINKRSRESAEKQRLNIKKKLIGEFNLHTVVRLPGSVFSPYTSITTNLLFFDNTKPTTETWFYRVDIPSDRKHFSKTKPMELKHFDDCITWWNNREVIPDGEYFKAQKYTADYLLNEQGCNIDLCGYPHEEEEVLDPLDTIREYQERRTALNAEIDKVLAELEALLPGGVTE